DPDSSRDFSRACGDRLQGLEGLVDGRARTLEQKLSRVRERHAPRRAREQRDAETRLELPNGLTERRRRDAEVSRRARDTLPTGEKEIVIAGVVGRESPSTRPTRYCGRGDLADRNHTQGFCSNCRVRNRAAAAPGDSPARTWTERGRSRDFPWPQSHVVHVPGR